MIEYISHRLGCQGSLAKLVGIVLLRFLRLAEVFPSFNVKIDMRAIDIRLIE